MKKWIIGSALLSLVAWGATPPTAKDAAYDKFQNKIINPGAENGTSNVSVSAGTLTVTTTSSEVGTGARAFKWCPAAAGNTLSFNNYTIEPGLRSNNGRVELSAQSATSDYSFRVWDGTNVIGTATTMTNISAYKSVGYDFGFPSSGTARAQVLSGSAGQCIFLDDAYLGKSTNLAQVSQATFVGSAYFPATASCSWSRTNTAVGAFGTDTDCPGPTIDKQVIGSWQTTDADLPRVTVNNLPAGLYKVTATAQMYGGGDWTMAISDGTDIRGYASGSGNGGGTFQPANVSTAWFEYTSSGNRSFEIYGSSSSGGVSLDNAANNDRTTFVIERYPTSSQTFVGADQGDFGWTSCTTNVSAVTTSPTKASSPAVDNCQMRRVNDELQWRWTFVANNNTGASSGSGTYLFAIPNSLTADSAVQNVSTTPTDASVVAYGSWNNGASREIPIEGFLYNSTNLAFRYLSASAFGNPGNMISSSNGFATSGSGWKMSFEARIKISGWSGTQRAPSLIGSYTSAGSSSFRQEFATITNSGTPTVSRTSSDWITSLTDNGTGDTTVNIRSGYCATIPTCLMTPSPNSDQGSMMQFLDFSTTRSTTAVRVRTLNGAASATDQGFDIMCMCQRQ